MSSTSYDSIIVFREIEAVVPDDPNYVLLIFRYILLLILALTLNDLSSITFEYLKVDLPQLKLKSLNLIQDVGPPFAPKKWF